MTSFSSLSREAPGTLQNYPASWNKKYVITFNEKFVGLSPHDSHLGPPPTCTALYVGGDLEVVWQVFFHLVVGLAYVRPVDGF